jgi:hypothetical protein
LTLAVHRCRIPLNYSYGHCRHETYTMWAVTWSTWAVVAVVAVLAALAVAVAKPGRSHGYGHGHSWAVVSRPGHQPYNIWISVSVHPESEFGIVKNVLTGENWKPVNMTDISPPSLKPTSISTFQHHQLCPLSIVHSTGKRALAWQPNAESFQHSRFLN